MLAEDGRYNYVAYLLADSNAVSIKVAKYAGRDKVNLTENEEYGYCSLIKATNRVLEKLTIENRTFTKITSTKRLERQMVNAVVLREAVVNAIVHNDYSYEVPPVFEIYSDRITVTSYGGLLPNLSRESFFQCHSVVRNRELMRVFRDLGLVEQLGSGMSRILKVYDERAFDFSGNFLVVTFPFEEGFESSGTGDVPNVPNNVPEKIILFLKQNNMMTTVELAEKLNISSKTVKREIKKLKESGVIERSGSSRTGYWRVLN